MCDPFIKNAINFPLLEEKLTKKFRSEVEGCSLLLALIGLVTGKYNVNTVRKIEWRSYLMINPN